MHRRATRGAQADALRRAGTSRACAAPPRALAQPVERLPRRAHRCRGPRGRRRTCSARARLRGRDSIRVRLTPASASSDRQATSQPGASAPAPQKTIAVFHGPSLDAARAARRAACPRAEPDEAGLVARRRPRHPRSQHLATVELGGEPVAERRPPGRSCSDTSRTASAVELRRHHPRARRAGCG